MEGDRLKVAFQGEIGAYSEEAALNFFGSNISTLPCKTLTDVFCAVDRGEAMYGLVPVENSIEGSIYQTYDLLLQLNLMIWGETVLRVTHCLISKENDIGSVKEVYSHPQALGQCRKFLESLKCIVIASYDTAGSVKMLKEKNLPNAAAIASERAARVYGMNVLARNIETDPHNYTRFLAISTRDHRETGNDKTSIIFSTKHVPSALYKALEPFAKRNINLTKIESRPIIGKPWEYNFYLDFEGHRVGEKVREALDELKSNSTFLKVLGSYPKAKELVARS
ncbi:MAG: prephenate dehydratase [Nitrososphaeria archaeon]